MPVEDKQLGGNIVLSGFDLEPVEMIVVRKIVGNHVKKIAEKCEYDKVGITLKKSQHGKAFLHEIKVHLNLKSGANLTAEKADYNLYSTISEALEKILKEIEHKQGKC